MGTDDGVGGKPLGELLEEAIRDAGYSIRGYAKFRAERTWGADTSRNQIDDKRRQLNKWISGETKTITDPVAEELAVDLSKPLDYFKTPKPRRSRRREEVDALRGELEALAARVEQLEQARQRGHGDHQQGHEPA